MNLIKLFTKFDFIPERNRMEWYPPFLFMGVKVRKISNDYQHLHLHLPLRWYGRNMHGSMFGGFICAVSDPMPVLMGLRLFPGTQAWVKSHLLEFVKPARGGLDLKIDVSDEDVAAIRESLTRRGQATHCFEYSLTDRRGRIVARVKNTVFFRSQKAIKDQEQEAV